MAAYACGGWAGAERVLTLSLACSSTGTSFAAHKQASIHPGHHSSLTRSGAPAKGCAPSPRPLAPANSNLPRSSSSPLPSSLAASAHLTAPSAAISVAADQAPDPPSHKFRYGVFRTVRSAAEREKAGVTPLGEEPCSLWHAKSPSPSCPVPRPPLYEPAASPSRPPPVPVAFFDR